MSWDRFGQCFSIIGIICSFIKIRQDSLPKLKVFSKVSTMAAWMIENKEDPTDFNWLCDHCHTFTRGYSQNTGRILNTQSTLRKNVNLLAWLWLGLVKVNYPWHHDPRKSDQTNLPLIHEKKRTCGGTQAWCHLASTFQALSRTAQKIKVGEACRARVPTDHRFTIIPSL